MQRINFTVVLYVAVSVLVQNGLATGNSDIIWDYPNSKSKNNIYNANCKDNSHTTRLPTPFRDIVTVTFNGIKQKVRCSDTYKEKDKEMQRAYCLNKSMVSCSACDGSMTSSISFPIYVTDSTPPTLTAVKPEIRVPAANSSTATPVDFASNLKTSDACDPSPSFTCIPPSGSPFPLGPTTVTCTATDSSNNTSPPATFTVTIFDTIPPVPPPELTSNTTIILEATGPKGAPYPLSSYKARDNVDGLIPVTCAPLLPTYPLGTTPVTCTATDSSNNTASLTLTITVRDTTAPLLTVPRDLVIEAVNKVSQPVNFVDREGALVASDLVTENVVPTCTPTSGSLFPFDVTTTVTCTATDASNNTATASFKVTVTDTTPPTLPTLPNPYPIPFEDEFTGTLPTFPPAADSVWGPIPLNCSPPAGTILTSSPTAVTCAATDPSGNSNTTTYPVALFLPPSKLTLSIPANIAVEAGPGGVTPLAFAPTATDTLPNPAITITCSIASMPVNHTLPIPFSLGNTTVTCTAKNRLGAKVSKSFTVRVQDTTPPRVIAQDYEVDIGNSSSGRSVLVDYLGRCQFAFTDEVTPTETLKDNKNCTGAPSNSVFPLGTTTVTCTTTDTAGNPSPPAACAVTVRDTVAPECKPLDVPPQFKLKSNPAAGLSLTVPIPACNDKVDGTIKPVCPPFPTNFPVSPTPYTIACIAMDSSNNTTPLTATFLVTDESAPLISVPASITLQATSPSGAIGLNYTTYGVTASILLPAQQIPVTCTPPGTSTFGFTPTTVTCTATHPTNRNTATATFQVIVKDTTPPSIATLPNVTLTANANGTANYTFAAPTATDNIDKNVLVQCTPPAGVPSTYSLAAPTTVICTATDDFGNQARSTFVVTVVKAPVPMLQCPKNVSVELKKGRTTTAQYQVVAIQGNVPLCNLPSPVDVTLNKPVTVTCTSTSASGDTAKCSFPVLAVDRDPPALSLPKDITLEADTLGGHKLPLKATAATATDAVDGRSVPATCTWPRQAKACKSDSCLFPVGTTTVTCTATDASNNTATATFKVTVTDTTPPLICADLGDCICADRITGKAVVVVTATAYDKVDGRIDITGRGLRTLPVGNNAVVLTARDKAGNVANTTAIVPVVDCNPPSITTPTPSVIKVDATGRDGAKVDYGKCTAKDNVTPAKDIKWEYSKASGSLFPIGTTKVYCMATDKAGRSSKGIITIQVRGAKDQCDLLQQQAGQAPASSRLCSRAGGLCGSIGEGDQKAACQHYESFRGYVNGGAKKMVPPGLVKQLQGALGAIAPLLPCGSTGKNRGGASNRAGNWI